MKKILFSLFVALIATTAIQAQQISVVSPGGTTALHRTLKDAIEKAEPGSVIYLPGGGFPISNDVKITKKLTIIGVGHTVKGDNVDGVTSISGNLWFNEGSSGSAVLACYITGDVNIGDGGASVNDVLIRYCNLNSVQVKNNTCMDTNINQNYIRNISRFNGAKAFVTNSITHTLYDLDNGKIAYNILAKASDEIVGSNWGTTVLHACDQTQILNNIVLPDGFLHYCYNCEVSGNMTRGNSDGTNKNWNDYFVNYNQGAISPSSDFHFKEVYKEYESQVGIYAGGTKFNDKYMAPVPYIVAKDIKEQTDSSGKLNVKIRVKANQ